LFILAHRLQTFFFGPKAIKHLCIAAIIVLIGWLSGHPIWTQEYRWQQICLHMSQSGDYLHPYLDGRPYYDKPLLSYWLMLGASFLTGGLNTVALRLPSCLAALSCLYCMFFIGRVWFDKATGLLAAWLLLTTFYFVFWGRVASTDILNVAAILGSIAWIFARQNTLVEARSQIVLLLLLVLGALLKGLIAPVLTLLVMLPWFIQKHRYRAFWQWRSLLWCLLAAGLYLSPFIASSLSNHPGYNENGLTEVFQENILRFFQPFDHQGGIQTYFLYAPTYLLPWTPLWLIALFHYLRHWRRQASGIQWLNWAVCSIFVFLSLSGSRRSYYILPLIPFALLQAACLYQQLAPQWQQRICILIAAFYSLLLCYFVVLQPCYYLLHY
jgi:4-amino-4-deoxy-L-arabinose transferase-like glycosyltransferase